MGWVGTDAWVVCGFYQKVIYLSSLIRCTIALHNLVNNKIKYKEQEELAFGDKKDAATGDKTDKKDTATDKTTKDAKKDTKAP